MMGTLSYGNTSRKHLNTVHPDLKDVFMAALNTGIMDISIIQGRRSKEEQDHYFEIGKSKVRWPNSKHNVLKPDELARALDASPYVNGKVSWNKLHCIHLAGIVLASAHWAGVEIRWGGNWDMDREPVTDQDFQDLVHYELID